MRARVGSAVVQVVIFGTTLALCGRGIGWLLPFPEVAQVQEKITWLQGRGADYDTLFLGSSRVARHVVPATFDRLAAERGMATRSFNLGVDNLFAPEDSYVLDQALAAGLPHLRWVFLEVSYFRSDFAGQSPDTIRAMYWHDWERTRWVWRQLADQDLPQLKLHKKRKLQRVVDWLTRSLPVWTVMGEHGRLFLRRLANFGRGAAWLEQLTGQRPRGGWPRPPAWDGFAASGSRVDDEPAGLEAYQEQLAAFRAIPLHRPPYDPVPQEHLASMLAKIRAHGAQPILFSTPVVSGLLRTPQRAVAPFFDFSDPHQWPELFEPHHRADPGHLNTAGAEIFTRLLAARFLALPPGTTLTRHAASE